jgi:heat shock protein HtpX
VITAASLVPRILYFLVLTFFVPRDDHGRPTITGMFASYIAAFVVELIASLMVRWLSRTRELYADEFSAQSTKKPRHMENALAKIGYAFPAVRTEKYEGMRQFYLADPVASAQVSQNISHEGHWIEKAMSEERGKGMLFRLFSTHPPTYKRIENLREMEKNLT